MEKYKLIVVDDGCFITGEYDNVVKGFSEAETRAEELLNEYILDYPDVYVACLEKDDTAFMFNYLIFQQDCYGEQYWKMMVMGQYCPLYSRLLKEDEEDDIDMLRDERERDICELNEEELKELRTEIRVGSIYISDYKNTFNVDENHLCDICEIYDKFLCTDEDGNYLPESEWRKDTPEEFAYFCVNFL